MAELVVGVLHPGEMGAAIAAALRRRGTELLWASSGRSEATARRAADADLSDAGSVTELVERSDVIVSVCPPHAAVGVARSIQGFDGIYVDANAVSPSTAREIAGVIEAEGGRFVDGGIVGPPPSRARSTRMYLSGPSAQSVADLFARTRVETPIVSDQVGAASAVKMAYAAWSKGTAAMLLAIRALARAEGIEDVLVDEWRVSIPELPKQSMRAARSAGAKGWRWTGEMEEIAATFASADQPDGFHLAAAEVFRRVPRLEDPEADEQTLELGLRALLEAKVRL
jgi:3-hydroxyisobutyrate dehydrogenase-like beta-hydroxyacid dehydrogenase